MGVIGIALLLSALISITGCATGTWKNLPPARSGVLAYHAPEDAAARRATVLAQTLSSAKPLPVDQVYVISSGNLNRILGPGSFPDDNAGTWRCFQGDPPPDGCIYIGDLLLAALSDDALAGVLAHELGHLERGHRATGELAAALGLTRTFSDAFCGIQAANREQALVVFILCGASLIGGAAWAAGAAHASQLTEQEADSAAIERLAAAGYCAGEIMRKTFLELATFFPGRGQGGLLASHPGYKERWESAPGDCPTSSPLLATAPASEMVHSWAVRFADQTDRRQGGVRVVWVLPGPGDQAGLLPGDHVVLVNGAAVHNLAALLQTIREPGPDGKPAKTFLIRVERPVGIGWTTKYLFVLLP